MNALTPTTEPMRDRNGVIMHVGTTVTVLKLKQNRSGLVTDTIGVLAATRGPDRAQDGLVQPHGHGGPRWVEQRLLEAPVPVVDLPVLEGS
jgi:hypothetical protein